MCPHPGSWSLAVAPPCLVDDTKIIPPLWSQGAGGHYANFIDLLFLFPLPNLLFVPFCSKIIFKYLKLVPTIFYQIIFFSTNDNPLKTEKCFLFHLKSSIRSRDIHIFVIFYLPFQAFQIQKDKWKWDNLWCHELTCINLQM